MQKNKTTTQALDLDGVLVKGGVALPGAQRVLERLEMTHSLKPSKRIPYLFMTNGGGVTEASKAVELSERVFSGINVREDQVGAHLFFPLLFRFYSYFPVILCLFQ